MPTEEEKEYRRHNIQAHHHRTEEGTCIATNETASSGSQWTPERWSELEASDGPAAAAKKRGRGQKKKTKYAKVNIVDAWSNIQGEGESVDSTDGGQKGNWKGVGEEWQEGDNNIVDAWTNHIPWKKVYMNGARFHPLGVHETGRQASEGVFNLFLGFGVSLPESAPTEPKCATFLNLLWDSHGRVRWNDVVCRMEADANSLTAVGFRHDPAGGNGCWRIDYCGRTLSIRPNSQAVRVHCL